MSRFDARVTKAERAVPAPAFLLWRDEEETDEQAIERDLAANPDHAGAKPLVFGWSGSRARARGRIPYSPRPQQRQMHQDQHRFKVKVCHRRMGKTVGELNEMVKAAIANQLPKPRYAYIAPTQVQVKDIAWEYLKHYTASIPDVQVNETELRVDFGGRRIRLYGADNADRLRGLYFDGVVLDEYAYMHPRVWSEIVRPALTDRQGWATFIGTPMGRNGFCDLYEGARDGFPQLDGARVKDPDWTAFMFKASETGLVPQAELDAARRLMSDDQYRQEFECDWDAAIPGAFYAQLLADAEGSGRVKVFPHEPALPVQTGWDLGIADSTAIWFSQVVHGEIRLLDYYEASGAGLEHYVAQLRAGHRASWTYGQHFFPHDLKVKELGSGLSRVDVLRGFGLNPTVVPASSVDDGISLVKFGLRKTWFNAERCGEGLRLLRQYRSDWDEKRQVLKPVPLHDFTSHCADALRTLFVGMGQNVITGAPLRDPSMSQFNVGNRARYAKSIGRVEGRVPYGWR